MQKGTFGLFKWLTGHLENILNHELSNLDSINVENKSNLSKKMYTGYDIMFKKISEYTTDLVNPSLKAKRKNGF